ncbi:MAG: hypothetical protein GEU93_11640 [Propionibacteriales bacterium]|nr:hypothetical protein [Propionibacteriales bacterium]
MRDRGATASARTVAGDYEVFFNRDVSECDFVATLGNPGAGNPDPGFIVVAARVGQPNGVFVATSNTAGASTDRSFHLQSGVLIRAEGTAG